MKTFFIKNWKTTSAGIVSIATGIVLYTKDKSQLVEALTLVLAGIGLILSKDADKTGSI